MNEMRLKKGHHYFLVSMGGTRFSIVTLTKIVWSSHNNNYYIEYCPKATLWVRSNGDPGRVRTEATLGSSIFSECLFFRLKGKIPDNLDRTLKQFVRKNGRLCGKLYHYKQASKQPEPLMVLSER